MRVRNTHGGCASVGPRSSCCDRAVREGRRHPHQKASGLSHSGGTWGVTSSGEMEVMLGADPGWTRAGFQVPAQPLVAV